MSTDDNEFLTLPDDPEEAFAILEKRKLLELQESWERNNRDWRYEREYVNVLLAFDEVYDLKLLSDFLDVPPDDDSFGIYFRQFRQYVERIKQKLLVEAARRLKNGTSVVVVLDDNSRSAIHKLIDAIRDKLNNITLSENKRDALFEKLNAFAMEIDKNRTRTEAFYAFAVDTARTAREVNDQIKPLQETIDRVFDWLDKAAKWKDALPPWRERREIGGPKKQLPAPDLDDDIPF